MTDNDIIKALECCILYKQICSENCPLCDVKSCKENLRKHCLDLINRQKAEIEKWKALAENGESAIDTNNRLVQKFAEIKSEAIKEFAERLKDHSRKMQSSDFSGDFWDEAVDFSGDTWDEAVLVEDIDELVKEMVGEKE